MESQNMPPVIGFIDIDSFECQLWQRDFPEYHGEPCLVETKSGRVLSVSQEAKELGISRKSTEFTSQARVVCPSIKIFTKPNVWGKPDSTKTRAATWEILSCIRQYCARFGDDIIIQLGSSDEFYIDISAEITRRMEEKLNSSTWNYPIYISCNIFEENSAGSRQGPFEYHLKSVAHRNTEYSKYIDQDEDRLALGALFMSDLCYYLFKETLLSASAGVGNNRLLAKVGAGVNKPGKVTLFHISAFTKTGSLITIKEIPGLGGQTGDMLMSMLNIKLVAELREIISQGFNLEDFVDSDRAWNILKWVRGIDHEPVTELFVKDKFTCNKPIGDITKMGPLRRAVHDLCGEVLDRLKEEKNRHQRTTDKVRFGFTLVNQYGEMESGSAFIYLSEGKCCRLAEKALKAITTLASFDEYNFRIRQLKLVVTDFVYL